MTAKTAATGFTTIGLIGKYNDPSVAPVVSRLYQFLVGRGHAVVLEQATLGTPNDGARREPLRDIGRHVDLAIVVGGDGTMLHVARQLSGHQVPLIGVNLGRLGFLTDLPSDRMLDLLAPILAGDYDTEQRMLLEAGVERDGVAVHTSNALNDVVINKAGIARLIEFETSIDDEFVSSTRADGIIIATPTGSTAYAVSAGGPILHPTLPAIALVPICPHTLSHRPILVGGDSRIDIVMTHTGDDTAYVTFDGQSNFPLRDGDRVRVRRAPTPATLIHPTGRNHYQVLRTKLRWGEKF